MFNWLLNKFNSWFKKSEPVEEKTLKDVLNKNYGQKPTVTKQDVKPSSEVKYSSKPSQKKEDSGKSSTEYIYSPYNPYSYMNLSGHHSGSKDSWSSCSSSSSDSSSSYSSSSSGGCD